MSTLSSTIDIDLRHPEEWRLSLRIEPKRVRFVAHSDCERDSLVGRDIELAGDCGEGIGALEGCIYDNPFFLQDFKQVRIVAQSMRFMVVPEAVAAEHELAARAFAALYGNAEGDIVADVLRGCGAAVVFELPAGMLPFLNRTFFNVPVRHHLSALCEHFAKVGGRSGSGRLYAYLHDDMADVVLFKGSGLALANTFGCRTADDAAFYILSVWNQHNLSQATDELQLTGPRETRDEVAQRLREYVTYVMPVMYPVAAMKMGKDSMKAPFDLILTSLQP